MFSRPLIGTPGTLPYVFLAGFIIFTDLAGVLIGYICVPAFAGDVVVFVGGAHQAVTTIAAWGSPGVRFC